MELTVAVWVSFSRNRKRRPVQPFGRKPVHIRPNNPVNYIDPTGHFPRLTVCVGRESRDRRCGQRRGGYRRTAADRTRGIAENDRQFVCRGLCSFSAVGTGTAKLAARRQAQREIAIKAGVQRRERLLAIRGDSPRI